jgi:hypothetical protein
MTPEHAKILSDLAIAAVGAFFGTGAGAFVALYGDRKRRSEQREERHVGAANLAILQLGRACDFLSQYQREVIDPDRNSPIRWLLMARKILGVSDSIRVDLETLGYLFKSSDPNVPSAVAIEFERFEATLRLIEQVKNLLAEAHVRMEERHIIEGATRQEIEGASGQKIVTQMRTLTDSIIDHVGRSLPSINDTAKRLHAATRELYPDSKVISFVGSV